MKNKKRIFTLTLTTALLAGVTSLLAQSDTPPPAPSADASAEGGHGGWHKRETPMTNLTKDEREELRSVIEKTKDDAKVVAAKSDVKEAEKAAREAGKAAVVKADPNAQAIFDSFGKGKEGRQSLTQEQREELRSDMEKVKDDSSVKTARDQVKKARDAYATTWRAAAVAADSKIQPVLDKLPKDWAPLESPRRGEGERRHHGKHGANAESTPTATPAETGGSSAQ